MATIGKQFRSVSRSMGLLPNHKYKTAKNFEGLNYDQLLQIKPSEIKTRSINRRELKEIFPENSREYTALKWLLGRKQHMSRRNSTKSHSSAIKNFSKRNTNTRNQARTLVNNSRARVINKDLSKEQIKLQKAINLHNLHMRYSNL
jgi:hypothetical protein